VNLVRLGPERALCHRWSTRESGSVAASSGSACRHPIGVNGQKHQANVTYFVRLLQPFESGIMFAQRRVDEREGKWRNKPASRDFVHSNNDLLRFGAAAG
jgi:hypothetical protein